MKLQTLALVATIAAASARPISDHSGHNAGTKDTNVHGKDGNYHVNTKDASAGSGHKQDNDHGDGLLKRYGHEEHHGHHGYPHEYHHKRQEWGEKLNEQRKEMNDKHGKHDDHHGHREQEHHKRGEPQHHGHHGHHDDHHGHREQEHHKR
ncbi:hypothetical protein E3P91_03466, partial [Wallemia ichthyophaga]